MTDDETMFIKPEPHQTPEATLDVLTSSHQQETGACVPGVPPWKKHQDTFLQKVEVEEQCVKITEDSLQDLRNKLNGYADDIWSSKTWIDRIDRINSQKKKCRVTIGFVGSTGTGKSTLISALVGQRDLVPSDHGDACTSVIVELLWNPKEDEASKYEARIQFVDRQQWQKDLERLYLDIAAEKAQDDDLDGELDSELSYRIDQIMPKVKAVYPSIKGRADLNKTTVAKLMDLENVAYLGKHKVIYDSQQKRFSSEIRPFIDSKAGQGMKFALWPLVKLVQIFTKSELLKDGIVLVDIPGNSDSNAARDSLAKSYMQKLSVTCVLSKASRAPADKGAQDLVMSKAAERTMQLDGHWNADKLCFLVVRTDESLIVESYIDKYLDLAQIVDKNLDRKVRCQQVQNKIKNDIEQCNLKQASNSKLRKMLRAELGQRCDSVGYASMSHSKKRKITHHDNDDDDEALTEAEKKVATGARILTTQLRAISQERENVAKLLRKKRNSLSILADDLENIESNLRAACIDYRNRSATSAIKANFEKVAEEIGLDHSGKPLRVFCLSALMYLNILDGRSDSGFFGVVDTGIPALRRWLIATTLDSRHHNAKSYLTQAEKLEKAIKGFAENTNDDHKMPYDQREELEHCFETETKELLESFSALNISSGTKLEKMIEGDIRKVMIKTERTASKSGTVMVKNFAKKPMYWSTYRAINANDGIFKSSKGITYNWNEELAGIYLDPLIAPWNQLFSIQLSNLQNSYNEEALRRLEKYANAFTVSARSICSLISDTLSSLNESILQTKDSIEENSREVFQELIPHEAKSIHRLVEPEIREFMSTGYATCAAVRGKKTFERMQEVLRAHSQKRGRNMFKSSGAVVGAALIDLAASTTGSLEKGIQIAVGEINHLFTLMLDNHTVDPVYADLSPSQFLAKVNLQRDISEIFLAMSNSFEQNVQPPVEEISKEREIVVVDLDNLGDDNIDGMGSDDDGYDFP